MSTEPGTLPNAAATAVWDQKTVPALVVRYRASRVHETLLRLVTLNELIESYLAASRRQPTAHDKQTVYDLATEMASLLLRSRYDVRWLQKQVFLNPKNINRQWDLLVANSSLTDDAKLALAQLGDDVGGSFAARVCYECENWTTLLKHAIATLTSRDAATELQNGPLTLDDGTFSAMGVAALLMTVPAIMLGASGMRGLKGLKLVAGLGGGFAAMEAIAKAHTNPKKAVNLVG
jgi:hypothetical protein